MKLTSILRGLQTKLGRLGIHGSALVLAAAAGSTFLGGCSHNRSKCPPGSDVASCLPSHLKIDSPELCDQSCEDASGLLAGPPPTLRNYEQLQPWDLTLEEVVQMTLSNSQVLNRLGGTVVAAPQSATTTLDPSIIATSPALSAEAALSAFDARWSTSLLHYHDERAFNNPIQEQFIGRNSYGGDFNTGLLKTTASGAEISVRTLTNYSRTDALLAQVPSFWTTEVLGEIRQPLARNAGTMVNRIAGPNAIPGIYNGVMIARIREDISLTGFEVAVRDLVRDTVAAYWELYFAYQDLDTKKRAREAARNVWETRTKRRMEIDRPDDEAIARQQYYNFHNQVQLALIGSDLQPGVVGAERQLRRLMGLNTADGRLIRPITEPTVAEVVFDWNTAQQAALESRVELRRQKWLVRQRELELCAARNLAMWRVDLVGQYGNRGFGDNLWGDSDLPQDGAIQELFGGELDNWRFGFEVLGPIGNRLGHLGVRNAQLTLAREKTLLREQQRQILHDLGQSYANVDLAYQTVRTTYNNRKAVFDEYVPKKNRFDFGEEPIFFVLEVTTRAANIESSLHRAVVEYNLALLDFAFEDGTLLEMFNVNLAEGNTDDGVALSADFGPQPTSEVAPGILPEAESPLDPPSAPAEQPAPVPPGTAAIIPIRALERNN